ncbi:MAG: M18 family aminopeptidase [Thermotogota bacterium]
MKDIYLKEAGELISFIEKSPSRFHAIETAKLILKGAGFQPLDIKEKWELKSGGKYYTTKNDSSMAVFIVGMESQGKRSFKIIGSHTDSPAIRIKPNPEMRVGKSYLKLNTEVYGGPILYSWFDRPLGLAGRVAIFDDKTGKIRSKSLILEEVKTIIPSIAIHMNREVNTGFKVDKQKDMLPFFCSMEETMKAFNLTKMIAEQLKIKQEQVLDFEMYLYDIAQGQIIGADNDLMSCSQMDDLAMVYASLKAILEARSGDSTKLAIFFDNEEIGSKTMQGADSPLLSSILERISIGMGQDREAYLRSLENSFVISSDMAHALHPNAQEKHDPTTQPVMNGGPVIKISTNFRYTSDSESSAYFESICKQANVPVQRFVNHSNERGGSTIAPITAGRLGIPSVDIGNPMLAMHSIKELCGVKDHHDLIQVFKQFYR